MREVYSTPFGRMTGITAICACIQRGNPSAQARGAAALRTALLDDDNESYVVKSDVEILIAAVIMGNSQTQAHAAAALANVCNNYPPSRDAVFEYGGIGALTALIVNSFSHEIPGVKCPGLHGPVVEAAAAIRNACIGHAGNRDEVMARGGIKALVTALASDTKVPASFKDRQVCVRVCMYACVCMYVFLSMCIVLNSCRSPCRKTWSEHMLSG
jgi:hypothetical protein